MKYGPFRTSKPSACYPSFGDTRYTRLRNSKNGTTPRENPEICTQSKIQGGRQLGKAASVQSCWQSFGWYSLPFCWPDSFEPGSMKSETPEKERWARIRPVAGLYYRPCSSLTCLKAVEVGARSRLGLEQRLGSGRVKEKLCNLRNVGKGLGARYC